MVPLLPFCLICSLSLLLLCLRTHVTSVAAASRNKYVVVGLGGATVRMSARLDSPVVRTLPQGTVRAMGADWPAEWGAITVDADWSAEWGAIATPVVHVHTPEHVIFAHPW